MITSECIVLLSYVGKYFLDYDTFFYCRNGPVQTKTNQNGSIDNSPDILRHQNGIPHGYSTKPEITHQNEKINRVSRKSGAEVVLTPQEAGASAAPHNIDLESYRPDFSKPSIEIVRTPQDAIRTTTTLPPYQPKQPLGRVPEQLGNVPEGDYYEEFEDEYAEISDFEREASRKQSNIAVNRNYDEHSFSNEVMKHFDQRNQQDINPQARETPIQMTDNDELYNNPADVESDYENTYPVEDKYYDLDPSLKHKSLPRAYEALHHYEGSHRQNRGLQIHNQPVSNVNHPPPRPPPPVNYNPTGQGQGPRRKRSSRRASRRRESQDLYGDDGEYYWSSDEWSGEEEDLEEERPYEDPEQAVRQSYLSMQDSMVDNDLYLDDQTSKRSARNAQHAQGASEC